jgi:hypothetical protein
MKSPILSFGLLVLLCAAAHAEDPNEITGPWGGSSSLWEGTCVRQLSAMKCGPADWETYRCRAEYAYKDVQGAHKKSVETQIRSRRRNFARAGQGRGNIARSLGVLWSNEAKTGVSDALSALKWPLMSRRASFALDQAMDGLRARGCPNDFKDDSRPLVSFL